MQRLLEILLGLKNGFLSQQGSVSIQFNPTWPWQQYVGGAAVWNLFLAVAGLALVIYVYRREGRSRRAKIVLGVLRGLALALVLILLNRPVLALGQVHREPSILAILVDDSISMKIKDVTGPDAKPQSRLDAVIDLLGGDDGRLLRRLAAVHTLRLFDFSRGPREIADLSSPASVPQAVQSLRDLKPEGDGTQVVASVHSVLEQLQGQRLAGVVVFSDGRDTPAAALPEAVAADKSFGVNIYPVPVGSDRMPQNIAVQSVDYEPIAFVDDVTDFHLSVRATGYEPNHPITLMLMRQTTKDGQTTLVPARDQDGREISKTVAAPDDRPFDVELQYKPTAGDMPTANLAVLAKPQEGELDDADNLRPVQLAVLDDKISMLYVEGYPRWDYRYLKNAMLRDRTVKISCLLTSADPAFRQEGSDDPDRPGRTWAITAFPTTLDQLLDYDVVVLGDVDPRQFTDAQLQLISDFVSKKGGGFAMVAGPRFSPQSYRNTPIEPLLPVIITHTEADDSKAAITEGFRPVLTPAGAQSSIFRFFADEAANQEYLKNHLQELFWYCRGVTVKPGVGIVYAEHPTDLGPDNRKAPILVLGRFGAGRTIFSAIDDSWRWRFYTGESIFNTYWIEQLRYLARGRKLGQRKLEFTADQDSYELGRQITLRVRLLSPQLIEQVSPPIPVQIVSDATGQAVRRVDLLRQGGAADLYSASFTADRVGQFSAKLTHLTDQDMLISYNVQTPQLELDQPQVDAAAMSRLASDAPTPFAQAGQKLAAIPSAAKVIPVDVSQPLWNAPLALALLAAAITAEWIVRKMLGML